MFCGRRVLQKNSRVPSCRHDACGSPPATGVPCNAATPSIVGVCRPLFPSFEMINGRRCCLLSPVKPPLSKVWGGGSRRKPAPRRRACAKDRGDGVVAQGDSGVEIEEALETIDNPCGSTLDRPTNAKSRCWLRGSVSSMLLDHGEPLLRSARKEIQVAETAEIVGMAHCCSLVRGQIGTCRASATRLP